MEKDSPEPVEKIKNFFLESSFTKEIINTFIFD